MISENSVSVFNFSFCGYLYVRLHRHRLRKLLSEISVKVGGGGGEDLVGVVFLDVTLNLVEILKVGFQLVDVILTQYMYM